MNTQAIENLKAGMNDRVSKDFDPLRMANANLLLLDLLHGNAEEYANKIEIIRAFIKGIFSTGNIACNLNIILQNQNTALMAEANHLNEEIKKLKEQNKWDQQ